MMALYVDVSNLQLLDSCGAKEIKWDQQSLQSLRNAIRSSFSIPDGGDAPFFNIAYRKQFEPENSMLVDIDHNNLAKIKDGALITAMPRPASTSAAMEVGRESQPKKQHKVPKSVRINAGPD